MKRIAAKDFRQSMLGKVYNEKAPVGNWGFYDKKRYYSKILFFDIETSKVKTGEKKVKTKKDGKITEKTLEHYDAFMYRWKLHICDKRKDGGIYNEIMITGRYWEEFKAVIDELTRDVPEGRYYVMYIHNLSHEFQFLAGIYDFQTDEVFAIENRQVVRAYMNNHIELRCSYKLTNQSLEGWLRDMQVEHQKTHDLDYDIVRFPWDELTEEEDRYCEHDVRGGSEALAKQLAARGDTLYTIPMTRTGYVRRDVKEAIRSIPNFSAAKVNPTFEIYSLMEKAFRGGDTHANRWYVGEKLEKVHSFDYESDYPAIMLTEWFPSDQFRETDENTLEDIERHLSRGKAILTGVTLTGLRLKDQMEGFPYLSRSKCYHIENPLLDNGRILSADYLETYITNLDLDIILDMYDVDDITFFDTKIANTAKLPEAFKKVIRSFYTTKTTLKGVDGMELEYALAKGDLNSSYGMLVQRMLRETFKYVNGKFEAEEGTEADYDKAKRKSFLAYQWGVWTTAYARYRLHKLRRYIEAHGGIVIYCDTDSVKFICDHEIDLSEYNAYYEELAEKYDATAIDAKGNKHYIGIADEEPTADEFKTWGAKRYAAKYIKDGKELIKITVAGVDKKKGSEEIAQLGGLDAFTEGMTFTYGGGTTIIYNDEPTVPEITDPRTGRTLKLTRNCAIVNKEYTMGIEGDYAEILADVANFKRKRGFVF